MKKRVKTEKKMDVVQTKPAVEKRTGRSIRKRIGAAAIIIMLLNAVFSTFRDSPMQVFQERLFDAVKLPFYDLTIGNISFSYPPYFIYNLIIIITCIILLFVLFSRRAGGSKSADAGPGGFLFYTAAAAIYCALVLFFLAGKHPYLQIFACVALLAMFAVRFIRSDIMAKIPVSPGVLEHGEALWLGAAFIAALGLYIFDFSSWKYSFIGDEYAFYDMAINILNGTRQPFIFAGDGVYGDHPLLASIYPAALMKIFGTGLFGWKISSLIIPPLTMAALYMFVKLLFKKRAAAIAAAAFIVSAAMMGFGRIAHDVVHPVLPFVLTLLCLELAMRKKSSFWSFAAGIVMGLGCYTFFTARLTVIAAALYWFFHPLRREYPLRLLVTGLMAYSATLLFVFITPGFMQKMAVHSVFGGSEVGNPAERPVYMVINYVRGFFAFLFKNNMSHFVAGPTVDWFTATGAMTGLIWAFCSFKRDWRARWLVSSYVILLVFVAGLVQYTYLPATRMNFMAPMIAIFAAVGFTRLAALLPRMGKRPFTNYVRASYTMAGLIAVSGLYYFFVYFPANFPFTPETYAVKYMQERGKDRAPYVFVTDRLLRETKLDRLYDFPDNFTMMTSGEFDAALRNGSLNGRVCVLSYDAMGELLKLGIVLKKGHTVRNFNGTGVLYEYDFRDENYLAGVRDLWLTGNTTLEISTGEINTVRPLSGETADRNSARRKREETISWQGQEEPAAGVQLKKDVLTKFGTPPGYKNLSSSVIDKYLMTKIGLPVKLSMPSDMDVSCDGSKMLICEGETKELLMFEEKGNGYKLVFRTDFYGRKKTLANLFSRGTGDREQRFMYGVIDMDMKSIYALDAATGAVREFDLAGRFIKEIIGPGFLAGARCLTLAPGGLKLGAAVPSQNMIVAFDIDGSILYNRTTTYGRAAGQFSQPSCISFDTTGRHYVMDTANSRVQVFDEDMNYLDYYPVGIISTVYGPSLVPVENGAKPYFMTLQPSYKRLLLYPLKEPYLRLLDLKDRDGFRFINPSVIRAAAGNTAFILDPKAKTVVRIVFPEGVIEQRPEKPGRR
ncbi:MAG: glycosyltransferase family 39 protein [Spirochaetia bacterium]|nr:glycosyltransferase family 39 protein [Spirochaetia bacterium]